MSDPPGAAQDQSQTRIAHTLTACTRCRQRKTRCDPALPRCTPCERTNSVCEYWDPAKRGNVNRDYVVYLQHKVRKLELELQELERGDNDDANEDAEAMVRGGAGVKMVDGDEIKFLGPSSGTQMTRLVMQLAKQFSDADSIRTIVNDNKARLVRATTVAEAGKPTSKIYPLLSTVAAVDLPNPDLVQLLIQLFNLKVQPMYPALHEPSFAKDVDDVYAGSTDPYQNFILRMVIAISLQKMSSQYAGLADSYYLAALRYFEPVIKLMNLKTLQAFALVAEYSLTTPTRTAIYYIMGMAVRLAQALGINEERTITAGKADCLEVDMRRRLFWCTWVMELGLAHALGRPSILATGRDHVDVDFFETVADEDITPDGILPGAQRPTLKKWIAVHFFKMRLLQLEIRRKLYQKKRAQPKDESDPWFRQMNAKLNAWRDASPNNDEGSGLDKNWFIGRYNTMIVFMYRPSPQVPHPTAAAAIKCFDACKYNMYLQREQTALGIIDVTWIFTQAIFMSINTILWSLSYAEVRRQNPRADVEQHLATAMDSLSQAADRWPGVSSAIDLYQDLIQAIMKIYDKDGDVPIAVSTPSDATSPPVMSDTMSNHGHYAASTSPAADHSSLASASSPPEHTTARGLEMPPPLPYHAAISAANSASPVHQSLRGQPLTAATTRLMQSSSSPVYSASVSSQPMPHAAYNVMSDDFGNAEMPHTWESVFQQPLPPPLLGGDAAVGVAANDTDFLHPDFWAMGTGVQAGDGIDELQQMELMQSLETSGVADIRQMVTAANRMFDPRARAAG